MSAAVIEPDAVKKPSVAMLLRSKVPETSAKSLASSWSR
jgi:hypothetical protein